jgi:hypothetical protein
MAHILVLDDEPDAVLFPKRVLQHNGHETSSFCPPMKKPASRHVAVVMPLALGNPALP